MLAFEASMPLLPLLIGFIFLRQSLILELWVWEKSVLLTAYLFHCIGLSKSKIKELPPV